MYSLIRTTAEIPAARLLAAALAGVLGLAGAMSPLAAGTARALGVIIEVNTTADSEGADGYCSLREAIIASNGGGYLDCDGSASADSIRFNIGSGTPTITLGSALPEITQQVSIRGNTGGATRVRLDGAASGFMIRSAASSTLIGSMVLGGIYVDGADNVTIVSNVVSSISGGGNVHNLRIGGSNPGTPDPCSGECNLITGNTSGNGIYFGSADGVISGNFIGVDATGNKAAANRSGILITSGAFTIGGTTSDKRNVISGNLRDGMVLHACTCVVQGNYVGTNAAGNAAIPNGETGITLDASAATVGGTTAGSANVISGNTGDGIYSEDGHYAVITIQGNLIGVKVGGGAMGNGGDGIHFGTGSSLHADVQNAVIGSTAPGAANTIAHNAGTGVRMTYSNDTYNEVRGNSIFSNGGPGILLEAGANQSLAAPTITGSAPLGGTACASCTIDIYSDAADEGADYEGTVTADGAGNWSYPGAVQGPKVTATATNASHSTSMFSTPFTLPATKKPDGRIRKGSGAFVGNNIYNTSGVNQTKSGTKARGQTITFGISIQNDGSKDSFSLQATGASTTMYAVTYFRGTTDITAAVVGGTYTTPVLKSGDKWLIKARVKVKSTASKGSSVTRLVTITSVGDATRQDAVKFIGQRS